MKRVQIVLQECLHTFRFGFGSESSLHFLLCTFGLQISTLNYSFVSTLAECNIDGIELTNPKGTLFVKCRHSISITYFIYKWSKLMIRSFLFTKISSMSLTDKLGFQFRHFYGTYTALVNDDKVHLSPINITFHSSHHRSTSSNFTHKRFVANSNTFAPATFHFVNFFFNALYCRRWSYDC